MTQITIDNFRESLDKVLTYVGGALDSCGDGKELERPVAEWIAGLDTQTRRTCLAGFAHGMTTLENVSKGYGLADVRCLIEWLDEHVPGWEH